MIDSFSITATFNCYQEHTSSPILVYQYYCHHHTQCIPFLGTMIRVGVGNEGGNSYP